MDTEKPDGIQLQPGQPKLMAAQIAADWANEVVVIQEKSKAGIPLLNPLTFIIPMDEFLLTAYNLGTQRIQRANEEKKRKLQTVSSIPHDLPKGPRRS